MKKLIRIILLMSCSLPTGSFAVPMPGSLGTVKIVFTPVFDGDKLVPGKKLYKDMAGDSLYIDMLRFYVGNFSLMGPEVECAILKGADSYRLVDAEDERTWTVTINNVSPAYYSDVRFTVGVDSVTNVSGAMGGDLDPVKGMYWAWNTGYIMAKLEGSAKACPTLHHAFEFHIGGYAVPYNTVRKAILPWPVNVKAGKVAVLYISVNVAAWFKGPLDLAKTNSITTPGKDAMQMADKYLKMFEPVKVAYE